MPAPKAILRDIHEFGLNPKEKHTRTHNGRLVANVTSVVPEQPELKSALVFLDPPQIEEELHVVEPIAQSTSIDVIEDKQEQQIAEQLVEHDVQPALDEVHVVASSKKNKKVKQAT